MTNLVRASLDYGSRTHHSNLDLYERLQPDDLAQAATVEAIFVYNAAMRDRMLPRKPLPHPELNEQRKRPAQERDARRGKRCRRDEEAGQ